MTPANRPSSRAIAGALLALAFVAGAAAGVIVDRTLIPQPAIRTRIAADLSGILDRLDLTPGQRQEAEAILQRSSPRTEAVMREVADRLRAVADSVDVELRAILTPEQSARLDSLRRQPTILLKRKTPGSATTVDTVFPGRRDSVARP
jgi:Spy/CpxP family protein refolding chaperone